MDGNVRASLAKKTGHVSSFFFYFVWMFNALKGHFFSFSIYLSSL